MQILQAFGSFLLMILNLFGPLIRLVGLIIQSIPGSKAVMKFIPFIGEPGEKKKNSKYYWPNGKKIYTRHDLMRDYLNDPDVIERMALERMNVSQKEIYFSNKKLRHLQYSQPSNVTCTVKFSGLK